MTVMTGRTRPVGLGPEECRVQPAWKVASPARRAPWVSTVRPCSSMTAAISCSDASEMGWADTAPRRWLPVAKHIEPTSGSRSSSGIHIVTVRGSAKGQ